MSAASRSTLRKASALMRMRAVDARDVTGASDWHVTTAWANEGLAGGWTCYAVRSSGGQVSSFSAEEEAVYIASWHPAVALAVADWLDVTDRDVGTSSLAYHAALAVADAYLGEAS